MTREEQLDFLIQSLAPGARLPKSGAEKWRLFRSLVNVREPGPVSEEFLAVQDDFLQNEIRAKGIAQVSALEPIQNNLILWQGDIVTLQADAIVNAANSALLGCFCPCHGCIDNAIHTYAGVQLRQECALLMQAQGHPERVGGAKCTKAYNLPSKYIFHTVGPRVQGALTRRDKGRLAACYRSCLELAARMGLFSLAFCCISTGEFGFPRQVAAEIAVETVKAFLQEDTTLETVVFNVFTDQDKATYARLLQ